MPLKYINEYIRNKNHLNVIKDQDMQIHSNIISDLYRLESNVCVKMISKKKDYNHRHEFDSDLVFISKTLTNRMKNMMHDFLVISYDVNDYARMVV